MANPQKGEIEFEIGGKTYVYLLGTYGLAKLEAAMGGQSWTKVLENLDPHSMRLWLAVFHCGLLLHHEPISEKEASRLLDELTLGKFMERWGEVLKAQFPGQGEDTIARPPGAVAKSSNNGIGTPLSAIG